MLVKILIAVGIIAVLAVVVPIGIKSRIKEQKRRIQKRADRIGYGKLFE